MDKRSVLNIATGLFLLFCTIVSVRIVQTSQNAPTLMSRTSYAQGVISPQSSFPYTVQTDVTYCTALDGTLLLADIYTPLKPKPLMPMIMFVHGGGWFQGDKSEITSTQLGTDDVLNSLTSAGFVVTSVNYRLAPTYTFPDMIEDTKCAVRYFRANSSLYNINPKEIGVFGDSAGGHIVELMGSSDKSAGWDVGQYLGQSSRPEAVLVWYGIGDLLREYQEAVANNGEQVSDIQQAFVPTTTGTLTNASPITYVTPDDPPVGIFHGVDDVVAYPDQEQDFFKALQSASVSSSLTWVQNAGHGFVQVGPNPISPSLNEIAQASVNFFKVRLTMQPN